MTLDERLRQRLLALIEKAEYVQGTSKPEPRGVIAPARLDTRLYAEWLSQATTCLVQVFGSDHPYTASFAARVGRSASSGNAAAGAGILSAALEDVEQGHLAALKQMVAAEVFSDFLEQAEYLCENGYVVAAASLAGAVLENGLRAIAVRNDITVKPRDDLAALNNKLGAKGVYNRIRQKQIATWIGIRNAADHGTFAEVKRDDVKELLKGVQNLLADNAIG